MKLGYNAALAANRTTPSSSNSGDSSAWRYANVNAPPTMDWRDKGVVTGVKNQGAVSQCVAGSSAASAGGVCTLVCCRH
jgi:C1A family cysteine protease